MTDIDRLLNMLRSRNVLRDIVEKNKRRMPCGDSRLAERMRAFGLVRLTNTDPNQRELTTSWVVTDLGQSKYEELSLG